MFAAPDVASPPSPAPARTHRVDGLHVDDHGPLAAPPIVLGHSLLCDRRMWDGPVAELARDFRCVVPDFRGHGRSPAAPRGFTMRDQGEDYVKIMDALGIGRALVVGLSMGAMAAMHLVAHHPERVRGLVFFNTSADRQGGRAKLLALGAAARAVGIRPLLRRQMLHEMFGRTALCTRPDLVATWDARFAALDVPGAVRALRMVVDRPAAFAELATIRVPLLVAAGAEDRATPPFLGRRIVEHVRHATWELMPCGHLSAVEQPELVAALVRREAARG